MTGQVLYDSFGGVLSSTLPFPPTSQTGGTADVATGLVHMGDGRWLDPALGRPLQPNPNGGPTDIPQALNRFTATPFGQPGIAEATASSLNLTPMALATGAAKSAAFEVLARSTRGFFGRTVTAVVGRNSFIEINASSTALQRSLRVIEAEGGQLIGKIPQANRQLHQVRFRMNDGSLTEAILREQANLPTSGRFKASVSFTTEEVTESVVAARFSNLNGFKLGLATDILLGVGFQLYGDSHDPFLMTGQRVGRIGVAAFGGGLSTLGGYGAGFAAGWLCGPGVVICAPVGIVIGSVATSYGWGIIQPYIFESLGLNSQRNLMPLN